MCTAALFAAFALASGRDVPGTGQTPRGSRPDTGDTLFGGGDYRSRVTPIREAGISVDEYLDGEWRLVEIARESSARIVVLDLRGITGRVRFGDAVAGYSECPAYDFAYLVDADGRLVKLRDETLPNASTQCPGLPGTSLPLETAPVPWDAMRVLHGDPELAILDLEVMLLSSGGQILVLERTTPPPSQPL